MTDYATSQELTAVKDSVDRKIGKLEKQLESHHKTLFGNGVPGWDEMLRTLYTDYLKREAAKEEAEKERRKAEAVTDKETKLQKIIGSWQFQIALLNGIMLVFIEIVKGLL